jgi:pyruvate/2-oxoglutarate dehydrogenase complex dihydrolipoamide dehydrogenase (E3) component
MGRKAAGETVLPGAGATAPRGVELARWTRWIGGACINVACIPTKSLVASARVERTLRRAKELGILVDGSRVDLDLLREHKTGVVEAMIATNLAQFEASGLELVMGTARFAAHCRAAQRGRHSHDPGA